MLPILRTIAVENSARNAAARVPNNAVRGPTFSATGTGSFIR